MSLHTDVVTRFTEAIDANTTTPLAHVGTTAPTAFAVYYPVPFRPKCANHTLLFIAYSSHAAKHVACLLDQMINQRHVRPTSGLPTMERIIIIIIIFLFYGRPA